MMMQRSAFLLHECAIVRQEESSALGFKRIQIKFLNSDGSIVICLSFLQSANSF